MLTTNQSARTEQPIQGVLVSKYESKAGSDLPEKSSFSKLLSSMQLETASEASVTVSSVKVSALKNEGSKDVPLSIMQQLPTFDMASNHAVSNLPAELSLNDSKGVPLSVMQQLPILDIASNHAASNLSAELSLNDSKGLPSSVIQQLPILDTVSNHIDSNLSAEFGLNDSQSAPLSVVQQLPGELSLNDSQGAPLSIVQQLPISETTSNQVDSNLAALDVVDVDSNSYLSAALGLQSSDDHNLTTSDIVDVDSNNHLSPGLSLNGSDAPLPSADEIANPLMTPAIDSTEVKADSDILIPSSVVSNKAAKNAELIEGVSDEIVQNIALNQSSVGKENSASVQLNSGISNAASNSATSWGTQAHAAMASVSGGDAQAGAQQSQTFTQGGQSGQNSQGQAGQQQAMIFAQLVKEGKAQALEQQTAVRALDESTLKSETKDLLGGAEIASADRRGPLPLGLQSIQQPLKHPQWGQALGQRVVFMANNSIQQAQITLNPEKLGQIQVTLQLDKDQRMNVSLNAQNGVTRESMENALPKLREMLEQAGITLGSMDVSDQKQFSDENSDKSTSKGGASDNAASNNAVEEGAVIESALSAVKTTDNIVDYYA